MSTLQQATFNKCTFYWRRLKWSGCLLPQCFENLQSQSESLSPPLSDGDKKSILMNIYVPPVFLEFVIRHLAFSYKESKPIIALLFDGDVTQSFWVCVAIRDRRLLKFLSRPLPWALRNLSLNLASTLFPVILFTRSLPGWAVYIYIYIYIYIGEKNNNNYPLLILYVCPLTKKWSVYNFNGRFIWIVRDRITTTTKNPEKVINWFTFNESNKYLIPYQSARFLAPRCLLYR